MDNIEFIELIGPDGKRSRKHRIDALGLLKTGLYKRYVPTPSVTEKPAPVKSITAENCQISSPVINAIVTGINNVINPANSFPNKT